jgi:hypothetical protein
VHVRVAPPGGGPRLNPVRRTRARSRLSISLLILSACWLACACHRPAGTGTLAFDWSLTPDPPATGDTTLTLRIRDRAGRLVHGAALRIEAMMSHPGMAPVISPLTERGDGVYETRMQFTMSGDWILLVAGTLSNGTAVQYRIDVPNVRSLPTVRP